MFTSKSKKFLISATGHSNWKSLFTIYDDNKQPIFTFQNNNNCALVSIIENKEHSFSFIEQNNPLIFKVENYYNNYKLIKKFYNTREIPNLYEKEIQNIPSFFEFFFMQGYCNEKENLLKEILYTQNLNIPINDMGFIITPKKFLNLNEAIKISPLLSFFLPDYLVEQEASCFIVSSNKNSITNPSTEITLSDVYQDLINRGFYHNKNSCEFSDIEKWRKQKFSLT